MTGTFRVGSPPQAPTAPTHPNRSRWRWWAAVGAATVITAAGAAWWGISVARHDASATANQAPGSMGYGTIRGAIELRLSQFEWSGESSTCWGRGGYDDLRLGAQVTVTDSTGKTIGLGRISHAAPQTESRGDGARAVKCTLSFEIDSVPRGAGFYGIEVAHRGVIRRAESDVFMTALQLTI